MPIDRPFPTDLGPPDSRPQSEPLTYHAPGWTVRGGDFEVICWAPGQIIHAGTPTGRHRAKWMLSVEVATSAETEAELRESGGVLSGESLVDVLPALAFLRDEDRYTVTAILVDQLGQHRTTCRAGRTGRGGS